MNRLILAVFVVSLSIPVFITGGRYWGGDGESFSPFRATIATLCYCAIINFLVAAFL